MDVTTKDKLPVDIEAAIQHMSRAQIECRDYGHAWKPWQAEVLPGRRGFAQVLRCARCTTTRNRTLTRFGEVLTSHYIYPDGYLVSGMGRLTGADRGQLRIASVMGAVR